MALTDLALCKAAAQTYDGTPATWEARYQDCHAYLSRIDGVAIVAFKGSKSLIDWIRDFEAIPIPSRMNHVNLGWLHYGFAMDVYSIWRAILVDLDGAPYMVVGHSKGGAEALIFAGLMATEGRPPERMVTLGAPMAGFSTLRDVLAPVPCVQYRFGIDIVPTLPIGPDWCHVRAPLVIGQSTGNTYTDHHIPNYLTAVPNA